MTDIRTYTRQTAPPWAKDITDTILAVAEPDPVRITVGEAPLVFGNPLRQGFAWRCGECLAIFRRGGPDPHAGVNYKTLRGATGAARKHAAQDHSSQVRVEEAAR